MTVKHLYLVGIAIILGCASTGTSPSAPRRGNYLNADDIATAHADITNAYDAISRLRPNWLAPHGAMGSDPALSQSATVYLDGQLYGAIETLRNIPAYYVAEIRYYDVTQAGARFGIRGGTAGVIEVKMKSP
jgi:hypothetical protein